MASWVLGDLGPFQLESVSLFGSFTLSRAARAAISDADVLSTHTKYDSLFFTPWAARRGVPSVFHVQGSKFGELFQKFDRTTRYVAVSETSRAELVARYHLPVAATVTPGVPKDFLELVRDEKGFLLFVGRLQASKGTSLVLRILKRILRKHPVLRLVVAGDGPDAESKALRLDRNVTFLGSVPHAQLSRYYATATTLLFPSGSEVFPLVPLEAMSAGCPVIAGRLPGVVESTGGRAVLLDSWDEETWTDAVLRIVEDSSLRKRLSEEGRTWAATHTWDKMAEAYERELVQAVNSPMGPIRIPAVGP